MTTFITGATSPLGRVLVRELVRQGEAVRILVRPTSNRAGLELPGVEFIRGDVTDLVTVRKGITGCDRVCHLAAQVNSQTSEAERWRVNRDGARAVLQAAQDLRVASVVHVSSVVALGPTQGAGADESHRAPAGRAYAAQQTMRRAADEIAQEYAGKGLAVKVVYPGFGYGMVRGIAPTGLTAQTLLRMASGKPAVLLGNGRNRLSVTYYKDIAQGILLAHANGQAGEGYLLVGANLTLPQIWQSVADLLGRTPPQRRMPLWLAQTGSVLARLGAGQDPYPADFLAMLRRDWDFSSEQAERRLGWRPRPFRAAIAETWEEAQGMGWGSVTSQPTVRALHRA